MRVARHVCNAVDRPQIAFGPLLVEGQQRRRFQRKHGKSRHERIGESNLRIAIARVRYGSEATAYQAKEGIGGEMFAFFGSNKRHGKPHQETFKRFQSEAYCRMDVYEKLTGRSAWLLGLAALRELLLYLGRVQGVRGRGGTGRDLPHRQCPVP